MKNVTIQLFLGLLAVGVLGGCATVMHGSSQQVSFESEPSGARVTINGKAYGRTPMRANLKRKDTHLVMIEYAGYEPYQVHLSRSTSGWVLGNVFIGGLIGLGIDAVSGGLYKLSPDEVSAAMQRDDRRLSEAQSEDSDLYVAVVLEASPNWEKIGQLERSAK